ncbi:PQQ-binding-like beta-propeller repeat protein [Longimicrobium sp.]|uniref:outer membrane protein assembly factor BamB family protein n=1 Tax=Longimicrobium sp. TaxID=2029185 RepID=UPI003B3B5839
MTKSVLSSCAVTMLLACTGCGGGDRADGSPMGRSFRDVQARTAWTRGGTESDTTLLAPVSLIADARNVYALDAAGSRVVALSAVDGSTVWTAGRTGSGPREFRAPSALALSPLDEIIVADPTNDRLAVLDRKGEFRGSVPLRGIGYPVSLCPLADSTIVVTILTTAGFPVVRLARSGAVLQRFRLPWADLHDAEALAVQSDVAALPDGKGCMLALALGRGFARLEADRFGPAHAYVEAMELPVPEWTEVHGRPMQQLSKKQSGARGAFVVSDRLIVPFGGESKAAGRIEDVYDARSGQYLYTHRLPFWSARTALAGQRSYHLTTSDGYPAIRAVDRS